MLLSVPSRAESVRRGQQLEYFTIAYNSLEGLISIVAGWIAGSVSLIGFGLDSLIEVTSGAALLWRLRVCSQKLLTRKINILRGASPDVKIEC